MVPAAMAMAAVAALKMSLSIPTLSGRRRFSNTPKQRGQIFGQGADDRLAARGVLAASGDAD